MLDPEIQSPERESSSSGAEDQKKPVSKLGKKEHLSSLSPSLNLSPIASSLSSDYNNLYELMRPVKTQSPERESSSSGAEDQKKPVLRLEKKERHSRRPRSLSLPVASSLPRELNNGSDDEDSLIVGFSPSSVSSCFSPGLLPRLHSPVAVVSYPQTFTSLLLSSDPSLLESYELSIDSKESVTERLPDKLLEERLHITTEKERRAYLTLVEGLYTSFEKTVSQTSPIKARAALALGKRYLEQGEHDKASDYFRISLDINHNNAEAHLLLGQIYFERQHFSSALYELRLATKLDNKNHKAWLLLGRVHFAIANFQYALECGNATVQLDPFNDAAHKLLSSVRTKLEEFGRTDIVGQSFQQQEGVLLASLRAEPHNQIHLERLQEFYFHSSRGRELIQACNEAFHRDPWQVMINLRFGSKKIGIHNNRTIISAILSTVKGREFEQYNRNVNGYNRNVQKNNGFAPLHVCAPFPILAGILIDNHKADINRQDAQGYTPVMIAASLNAKPSVQYLLSKGADLAIVSYKGNNVFHMMVKDHVSETQNPRNLLMIFHEIILFLRQADGDKDQITLLEESQQKRRTGTNLLLHMLTSRNKDGYTVVELADTLGKTDLLGLLRETLCVVINERLSGFTNNLYVVVGKRERRVEAPIFSYFDEAELGRAFPNSLRVAKRSKLYIEFLDHHLTHVPGSALSGSLACRNLLRMVGEHNALTESLLHGKLVGNKKMADDLVLVAQRVLEHGFFDYSKATLKYNTEVVHLLSSILPQNHRRASTPPFDKLDPQVHIATLVAEYVFDTHDICYMYTSSIFQGLPPGLLETGGRSSSPGSIIISYALDLAGLEMSGRQPVVTLLPQPYVDICREFVAEQYRLEFQRRLQIALSMGGEDKARSVSEGFRNLITRRLGIELYDNDEYFEKLTQDFISQLDKEIGRYKAIAERNIEKNNMQELANIIVEMHVNLLSSNKESRLLKVEAMLTQIFARNSIVAKASAVTDITKQLISVYDTHAASGGKVMLAAILNVFGESCVLLANYLSETGRGTVSGTGEGIRVMIASTLREAHQHLLKEKTLSLIDPTDKSFDRSKLVTIPGQGGSYIAEESVYKQRLLKDEFRRMHQVTNFSNTPSYNMLIKIFEHRTLVQLRAKRDNFGWVETVREDRGERKDKSEGKEKHVDKVRSQARTGSDSQSCNIM